MAQPNSQHQQLPHPADVQGRQRRQLAQDIYQRIDRLQGTYRACVQGREHDFQNGDANPCRTCGWTLP